MSNKKLKLIKNKRPKVDIIIPKEKSWFEKCLDRIEAGKSPFPKKSK